MTTGVMMEPQGVVEEDDDEPQGVVEIHPLPAVHQEDQCAWGNKNCNVNWKCY